MLNKDKAYEDIFRNSIFWIDYKEFKIGDVIKACECTHGEAKAVLRILMAKKITDKLYRRSNDHPLKHKPWRTELLGWEGKYTPNYC